MMQLVRYSDQPSLPAQIRPCDPFDTGLPMPATESLSIFFTPVNPGASLLQSRRLPDPVREVLRCKHYSLKTGLAAPINDAPRVA